MTPKQREQIEMLREAHPEAYEAITNAERERCEHLANLADRAGTSAVLPIARGWSALDAIPWLRERAEENGKLRVFNGCVATWHPETASGKAPENASDLPAGADFGDRVVEAMKRQQIARSGGVR